jgi:hypothetical protein
MFTPPPRLPFMAAANCELLRSFIPLICLLSQRISGRKECSGFKPVSARRHDVLLLQSHGTISRNFSSQVSEKSGMAHDPKSNRLPDTEIRAVGLGHPASRIRPDMRCNSKLYFSVIMTTPKEQRCAFILQV